MSKENLYGHSKNSPEDRDAAALAEPQNFLPFKNQKPRDFIILY